MATYVMGFKEMLIKARLSPAIATRSTASVASGAKAPATRGNLLKCGYSRSHNVSGAKAPATRGNLLECGYSRSHNVSGHTPCDERKFIVYVIAMQSQRVRAEDLISASLKFFFLN